MSACREVAIGGHLGATGDTENEKVLFSWGSGGKLVLGIVRDVTSLKYRRGDWRPPKRLNQVQRLWYPFDIDLRVVCIQTKALHARAWICFSVWAERSSYTVPEFRNTQRFLSGHLDVLHVYYFFCGRWEVLSLKV